MPKTYVIIGAIAAGTSAAAKIRRSDEDAEILIYDMDKYISYGTCGLPYFVSGTIKHMSSLLVNTVENFEKRFNLKVFSRHKVTAVDTDKKIVKVRELSSGKEFVQNWDKLIITTGSKPVTLNMPGMDAENVFGLKTIADSLSLKKYMENLDKKNPHAVIIGGGFIGLELLEAFLKRQMKVTIVEKTEQLLPMFDKQIIEYLHNYLADRGVRLLTGEQVAGVATKEDKIISVDTVSGKKLPADLVFMGIGTRPEVGLAKQAGIALGNSGAVAVNKYMQTNVADVYAAGDCCECLNEITGQWHPYNLASIANRQGRVAGYNAAGGKDTFNGSNITSIIKVLDIAIAKTGISLSEAKSEGINAGNIELHYLNHAGYYPGAEIMHMMLIYDRDSGRVLGMEAIGRQGVDKRADVVSVAIKNGMKAWELDNLDLCYQPEYGSAKDPINILGMIGDNIRKKEVGFIDSSELEQLKSQGQDFILLDVRTPKEYGKENIEGSVNIYVDQLRDNLDKLDRNKLIIIYCLTGYRAYIAYRILYNRGYRVKLLNGSILSWYRKI
ncbi:MAG: FAD-dependent oxidoreductase [Actinomycetia bacterium]|nr:FAD-dependent oxidoreductase [Actinomycetes bacterium]